MTKDKIVFNITFHWQIEQLKWHLENLFSWECVPQCEYLLVSCHKENLDAAVKWVDENYPDISDKVSHLWIDEGPEPYGNHLGCTVNVIEGLKHIRDNMEYDFIANVEADNQFRHEGKFLKLIDKLKDNNKHMLLIDHPAVYGANSGWTCPNSKNPRAELFTLYPSFGSKAVSGRNYFHMTTLNIYDKYCVEELLPLYYDEEFMNYGWCGAPGTPFEPYFALATQKKNNLNTDNEVVQWLNENSYPLWYDRNTNPYNCPETEPDDLTPDKYMKYGILNCPNERGIGNGIFDRGKNNPDCWKKVFNFVKVHDPHQYDFE